MPRLKSVKLLFLTALLVTGSLFFVTYSYAQETLTITSYYPSPSGSYKELTAHRMKIGTNYSGSGTTVADNNLIVEGSVGLGTTTLTYKLNVAGDINVTGDLRKSGTAYTFPDYVFKPEYKLMSLQELKGFISKNQHLPNMPSAEEVNKEGVRIFEQNKAMLEKLEEAYLYILQLEQRISKLETQLADSRHVSK